MKLPLPAAALTILPGCFLARAMSSFTELAGTPGWTVRTTGPLPILAMGTKDFTGSYGTLKSKGLITIAEEVNNRV